MRIAFFVLLLLSFSRLQSQANSVPVTLRAKLRHDSIEKNEAYYYRINKVKQVQSVGEVAKSVDDIDSNGNVIKSRWWVHGELSYIKEFRYNNYGNLSASATVYVDGNGNPYSVTLCKFIYETDSELLTQRCVREVSEKTDYRGREINSQVIRTTVFTYDDKGRVAKTVESGVSESCEGDPKEFREETISTYSDSGWLLREDIRYSGCQGKYVETNEYSYLPSGERSSIRYSKNGELREIYEMQCNAWGRVEKYTSSSESGHLYWTYTFQFNANGLIASCASNYEGAEGNEIYTYTYY